MRALGPVLPYVVLMRPGQWVKNLLVFAPVFFAGTFMDAPRVLKALGAGLIFCAVSSAMYICNDILDAAQDRLHPTKRARPLASGAVGQNSALAMAFALLTVGSLGVYALPAIFPAVAAYVLLNILYTGALKHIAVVDLALVALFYVLRVIAGGEASMTYISPWIILCVLFGAFFLTVGKRRAEFAYGARRKVLDSYSKQGLDALLIAAATLAVSTYGLYSVLGTRSAYAVYSTLFVAAAVFRVANRMFEEEGEAEYPETLVFKDRWVLLITFLWAVYLFVLLYI